jgi:small subunit ribosomal protein S6
MAQNRQYEIVYIVAPSASEQEIADVQAQIESAAQRYQATIDKTENWGRRRLAYDIAGHKEGTYVLQVLTGPGEMIKEIERRLRVFDTVIRYLAVRVDEDVRIAERVQSERKAETARRRAARGLPPEVERSSSSADDENEREEAEV